MDSKVIARRVADELIAHRDQLAGKAEDAHRAQAALEHAAKAVTGQHTDHRKALGAVDWSGKNADGFRRRAHRMSSALDETASAASRGASVVAATASSLDGNHRAVARLVDEYTTKAAAILDGARAVQGAGSRSALVTAVGQVVDLVRTYTNESTKHVNSVRKEMTEAAASLRKLERRVEHDGVVDPSSRRRAPASGKPGVGSAVVRKARSQLGYREGPGNANKYGPKGYWCSNFATWVWQKSGVDIGILPFTGDVYNWGREHGLAYGKNSLDQARPGDVLLFGTGPDSPTTSTHIGIVESVHGNQVTLIEGNSADSVRRVTHTLSSSTFYGGVHPK